MRNKQILALFVCNLALWAVGNGLLPLLPVYAIQLGADQATAGYYLAFSYFAIASGAVSAGWVSDRLHRRKLPIILIGLVILPVAWLMGRVENVWALSALTAILWFCGGLGLALVGILAGLSAGENERGKIFGILSLTSGLGALIGGLAIGFAVDRWGFTTMFSTLMILLILIPLAGIFMTEEREKAIDQDPEQDQPAGKSNSLGRNYRLLFSASLVASTAGFVFLLGRSLLMDSLDFGAMAISSTGAISGVVAMPIPFLMGWLSDPTGRKIYIYISYLIGTACLLILAVSTSIWQFFIASILQALFIGINGTVGNALVTDLVPRKSLGRGLALFGATVWIGGILGFAGAGFALQNLGALPTFFIGACLPLIALFLVIPIQPKVKNGTVAPTN
jgi:MFS family permease